MVHAKLGLKQTQDLKKKTFQTTVRKKVERIWEIKKELWPQQKHKCNVKWEPALQSPPIIADLKDIE